MKITGRGAPEAQISMVLKPRISGLNKPQVTN